MATHEQTTSDGHEQINLETISDLTIKDGQLYWKKQKLKTETVHHLVLSKLQLIGALILGLAAVCSPIFTYVSQLHNICPNTNYRFPFCADWKARQPVAVPASPPDVNPPAALNNSGAAPSSALPPDSSKKSKNAKNKSAAKQKP